MATKTTWAAFVCPECGWAETKCWGECYHICDDPSAYPQPYDPRSPLHGGSTENWVAMCRTPRDRLKRLVSSGVLADRLIDPCPICHESDGRHLHNCSVWQ